MPPHWLDDGVARRLKRWVLQAAARELMGQERVAWCMRRLGWDPELKRTFQHVKVMYSDHLQRAHYKNLMVCGSVWMCPICSAKISERRRFELSQAIERSGLQIALVSVTLQHDHGHSLDDSLVVLLAAYRALKSGRTWKEFCKRSGLVGSIRSLEVTYGLNGWHPHLHVLTFFQKGVDLKEVSDWLKSRWIHVLGDHKRSASWRRGVDVRTAESDVADYVAKWGHEPEKKSHWTMEHELTKGVTKLARGAQGLSMLQLLELFSLGDRKAGELWKQYARSFKGKRQLVWSRGLRGKLGLGPEQSDEELAKREDEQARLLALLSLKQWKVILANDARGEVLEVASSGDPVKLNNFLMSIGVGGKILTREVSL